MNAASPIAVTTTARLRLVIRGAVQGVGFRPFVYRLATELGLTGWVNNSAQGVFIEVEGAPPILHNFLLRITTERPPRAVIQSLESAFLDPCGYADFTIRHSEDGGAKTALVLPDIAVCADCLADVRDPRNRRYRYPFTNCTNCGPRFSIIDALPYDRAHTTMKHFAMCAECQAEYENPLDRRFHAQPNACPRCGPQLELWNAAGQPLATKHEALLQAAAALRTGKIVAVKGLGGFHLIVNAHDQEAVLELRRRKHREEKPLALLYPTLTAIEADCEVSPLEARLLQAPEAPIVLLKRRATAGHLCEAIAPQNPYLGVMLPYTPLHHLLLDELPFPVVATSGNLSDEPICIDEQEARERLAGLADFYLVHNRPINRHVDDSIVRIMAGREIVLRRARGYAPLPVPLSMLLPPGLATGAHLKNTVAMAVEQNAFVSQHIGDLETLPAFAAFQKVIADFAALYEIQPARIACDAHPDYLSTRFAQGCGLPVTCVQHHFAHVLACLAENEVTEPALGVAWDGTGYGDDGTIWGGEFLRVENYRYERVAHWRQFRLPGGEKAVREPRRIALGLLYEIYGEGLFEQKNLPLLQSFSPHEQTLLRQMLRQQVNAPLTSSVGRLFDAVAALAQERWHTQFEGQAAMALEFAIAGLVTDEAYPVHLQEALRKPLVIDWEPMVRAVLTDLQLRVSLRHIAAKFHNTLVEAIIAVALHVGEARVALTGGCWQNKYLTERAVQRLRAAGFRPYWHQRIPPNDGGIALGQLVALACEESGGMSACA